MKTITIKATKVPKETGATGKSAQEVIRDAYETATGSKMTVIPARRNTDDPENARKLRVCAYCRVSTGSEEQASSYEMQYQYYSELIQTNPRWEFVGIYADQGLSGTSVKKRDQFLRMIEDCKQGKIDKILVKMVSRFSRNVEDCLHYTRLLKGLSPPVSVFFETQHIDSLTETSETQIITTSMVAQGESEGKSISMKWSNRNRFQKGLIYPVWSLLGYVRDENRKWAIEPHGAEIVQNIFSLYLDGYSSPRIADILNQSGIETATGTAKWSSGSVCGILRNEKFCGDALCQKTITVDLFEHKAIKNDGRADKFFHESHHAPIVSREDWLLVQEMLNSRYYRKRSSRLKKPRIIMRGGMMGFFVIDPTWSEDDVDYLFFRPSGNTLADQVDR